MSKGVKSGCMEGCKLPLIGMHAVGDLLGNLRTIHIDAALLMSPFCSGASLPSACLLAVVALLADGLVHA